MRKIVIYTRARRLGCTDLHSCMYQRDLFTHFHSFFFLIYWFHTNKHMARSHPRNQIKKKKRKLKAFQPFKISLSLSLSIYGWIFRVTFRVTDNIDRIRLSGHTHIKSRSSIFISRFSFSSSFFCFGFRFGYQIKCSGLLITHTI